MRQDFNLPPRQDPVLRVLPGIAFKTVVVHRHHIQTKLKVHNTADLMRTALRMGLIEP